MNVGPIIRHGGISGTTGTGLIGGDVVVTGVSGVFDDVVVGVGIFVVVGDSVVGSSNAGMVVWFCIGVVAGAVVVLVLFRILYLQSHMQYVDSLVSLPS